MRWIAGFTTALLVLAFVAADAALAQEPGEFTNHGVGAQVSRSRGITATVDGEGKRIVLVWMMDHGGGRDQTAAARRLNPPGRFRHR